ncbi:MAG TPA: VanZ family protein [Gaiellaceae bacterium]
MRKLALWGPVVVWMAVIFGLSSIPSLSSGLGTWDEFLRKGAHITEYAILGALLFRALGRWQPALLIGIAYAATDEIHQHFVQGRHSSPFDVAFDACGLALGLLAALSAETATLAKPAWPLDRRRKRAP